MLVVASLVAGGARAFGRAVWIYPIVAAFVGSVIADVLALTVDRFVSDAAIGAVPFDLILAAAVLNAAIVAILLVPARMLALRVVPDEMAAW
jgi:hypothetical protein